MSETTEPETDAEFLERCKITWPITDADDFFRLIVLAERGALVPDEATDEMEAAVHEADLDIYFSYRADGQPGGAKDVYRVMLATALKGTSHEQQPVVELAAARNATNTEAEIERLARAIYKAFQDEDDGGYIGEFQDLADEDGSNPRTVIDSHFDLIAIARALKT